MKMIESVVYLYEKSQRLVFSRFQRTAESNEPPGSKEQLGRVNRFGLVPGTLEGWTDQWFFNPVQAVFSGGFTVPRF